MLEGGGSSRLGQVLSLELHSEDATGPGLPQVRIRVGTRRRGGAGGGRPPVPRRARAAGPAGGGRRAGSNGSARTGRPSRSESWRWRAACRSGSMPAASGATPSSAASRAPARPTRWAFCSSGCSWRRRCAWSCSTRTRTTCGWASRAQTRRDAAARSASRRSPARSRCAAARTARRAIRVRFRELSPAQQAALLRLDPLADREEYAELTALVEDESVRSLADLEQVESDALKLRARNLGHRSLGHLARARGRVPRRRARGRRRAPLPRRRPGIAGYARGAGDHRGRRARAALAPAGTARADRDRDRRGPQRLPGRTPATRSPRSRPRTRSGSQARDASSAST